MKLAQLQNLAEAKKTHDQCSDEIDSYHADTLASLMALKKSMGEDSRLSDLTDAIASLNKAISLAKNWNRRCG